MASEQEQIEAAIAALSAQRGVLGDVVVDLAVAPLRARLAACDASLPGVGEQTLRQVTILLLDVVGSTALSQHLDPEDIHALLDGTLARCTELVAAHRGRVLQYAGDSLLAVFGADLAREDDAEQAVHAGLALLDEGRRQADTIERLHRHVGFDVRVGLHTGSVLLGGGADHDGVVRGVAVTIAAALERAAPAGGLRISRDSYLHVRGLFDVVEQSPLAVEGIDEPVASYLVQRAKPRAFRVVSRGVEGAGGAIAMIGRDAEFDTLMRLLDEARTERSLRRFTVSGDAGIGKSRLLLEIEARLDRGPVLVKRLHGRAQRHGINVPHGVVRDMLAWHCDIADSDGPDEARAKLVGSFGAVFGDRAEEQSALVGQMIGLDFADSAHIAGIVQDGRQVRARAFHAIAQYLRLQCTDDTGLVVLLLDDLHWADDGSLDLIEHLATACRDLPLVLGCFTRPALFERRPQWGDGSPPALRVALHALGESSSEHLMDSLLSRMPDPSPELQSLILRNAGGNPFHMEELLGMLIDDGVIVCADDGWRVDAARLKHTRVPSTLTAVLQARLDTLPPREKLTLQRASVIGQVFWDEALRSVAPESLAVLPPLCERELITRRDDSSFASVGEYAFRHHLLHQVAYDTVLKTARRDLHRRTAAWLVTVTGERVGEHLGLIADHFERAGDALSAVDYLRRAADAAYGAAAFGVALDYLGRALALCAEDDLRTRFELLAIRNNVYNATGRRKEQADDVALQARYAESLDDDGLRARVARWHALLAVLTGAYADAIVAADRATELARTVGDTVTALAALLDKSQALLYLDDLDAADACLKSLLPIAHAEGKPHLEITASNRLATVASQRGDYGAARRYLEQALAVARSSGNRRFEGALMGNLGEFEAELGHFAKGRALAEAGLHVSREIGDRGSEPYALHVLGAMLEHEGQVEAALAVALEARVIAAEVVDRGCEALVVLLIGTCHAALGHVVEAETMFDEHDGWSSHGAGLGAARPTMVLRAAMALARGRLDEAVWIATQVVEWLDARPATADRDDIGRCFVCHRVLAAAGDPRADEFLERAHALLADSAATLSDADRRTYLGHVRLHRDIADAWNARLGRASAAA